MGRVSKGAKCSVEGCDKEAIRSLDSGKAHAAGLKFRDERRVFLCREHYKEYKKALRKDRVIERWRRLRIIH
ncbi:MAG: hypothetical protein N3E47_03175 [Candidatus Bathyarchaeota archaeon]|nr:hypothetical protein [Candidatus Bathyarchaeota archaeon]